MIKVRFFAPHKPAAAGSTGAATAHAATPGAAKRIRVYIVDEHPLFRLGLAHLINAESDMVVAGDAGDADAGFAAISAERPDIAIVALPLTKPSAIALIRKLRTLSPRIGTVAVSLHYDPLHALRLLSASAWGHVSKSDLPERLLQAIRRVHDGCISPIQKSSTS